MENRKWKMDFHPLSILHFPFSSTSPQAESGEWKIEGGF
jgi:hypothetical protein